MESFYQEHPVLEQGILYPYDVNSQEAYGKCVMANAHWHDYIELLYCTAGKAKVFISGIDYDFAAGDMVLINSREVHSVLGSCDGPIKYIVVKCDPNVLYSTSISIFELRYVLPFTLNKFTHQKVFTEAEIKDTDIPKLIHDILNEFVAKDYGCELAIRNNIGNIFLWILRNWHKHGLDLNVGTKLSEATLNKMKSIFDFVNKNYMESISAESVASEFNMSYSYFSRFFKASVGKTFTSYLNYVRITEAEKLLISTDLTITEIAMKTGFSSSSYFIELFKHYRVLSPKQFKKKFVTA